MLMQATVGLFGNVAKVEFAGGTSGEALRKRDDYLRENPGAKIVTGPVKKNPFLFVCRLYYELRG